MKKIILDILKLSVYYDYLRLIFGIMDLQNRVTKWRYAKGGHGSNN